ncbi:hypothetical protein FRC11_003354, partial [Ceratobasidium sp. 423]
MPYWYRYIDKTTKLPLLRLRKKRETTAVENLSGVSRRTIQRIVQSYNTTGSVVRSNRFAGRPRKLTRLEVS